MHVDWTIHATDILAILGVCYNLYLIMQHRRTDCKNLTMELTEIKTKLDFIYDWFQKHILK
jgi:hypothetical protein